MIKAPPDGLHQLQTRIAELEQLLRLAYATADSASSPPAEPTASFEVFLGPSPIPYLINLNDRIVYLNDAALRVLGGARSDYAGRPASSLVHADYAALSRERARKLRESGEAAAMTGQRWIRPDGSEIEVEVAGWPIPYGTETAILVSFVDVTERKRLERSVRESESRYRSLTEATAAIVWNTNAAGYFESDQPSWSAFTGQSPEELRGGGALDAVHPEDRSKTAAEWTFAVQNRSVFQTENRLRRYDGEYRAMSVRAVPILADDGSIREWVGVHVDITDRKQAEQALQEQLRLTRAITHNASASLFIMNAKYGCAFMNPAAEALTGYTLSEVRGLNLHDLIHGKRPDGSPYPVDECPIAQAGAGDRVYGEETFVHKDGSFYPVAFTVSPIREGSGTVGTVIEVQSISERKVMEQALRASEERLKQVLTQAPVAVAVLRGPEMVFELANPLYQAFFPGRELIGRRLNDAVPEMNASMAAALQDVLRTGEPFVGNEYLIPLDRDSDGILEDCWFTFVYHPIHETDGSVSGMTVVAVDVTPHVRARQGLEHANRGLEEFAYVASHDLQEPLRMVNTYTQLLLRRGLVQNEQAAKFAGFIEQGVLRMERLIQDLLSYSRVIHADTEPVLNADLSAALAQAVDVLDSRIRETNATISCGPLPAVKGDISQLALVFQNLLSNSLKYRRPEAQPHVEITGHTSNDECIIAVRDNGIGFDPQYATRIFGLFKRLHKDEYPGTGLGLAICQRIVERFGGRMWADSTPGEGSVFYFALPAPGARR